MPPEAGRTSSSSSEESELWVFPIPPFALTRLTSAESPLKTELPPWMAKTLQAVRVCCSLLITAGRPSPGVREGEDGGEINKFASQG